MKNATTFLTWLVLAIAMAISGIVYGVIVFPGEPAIIGGVFAILIGVPVLAFERGIFLPRLSQRIQKLPTVPFVVAAVVAYEVIMSVGYAVAAPRSRRRSRRSASPRARRRSARSSARIAGSYRDRAG